MYKIVGGDQKEYGPVTAEMIRQWIIEGRANGQTLAQVEAGPWKPLSTFAEFADLLGRPTPSPTPAPSSVPGPLPALAPLPSASMMNGFNPRQAVQGPAIGLVILGIMSILLYLFSLLTHTFGWALANPQSTGNPEIDQLMQMFSGGFGVVIDLIMIGLSALILGGGLRMLSLKSYGLAIAASVIALLPCVSPCCCLGLPLGIWSLVVLMKPEVKASFF